MMKRITHLLAITLVALLPGATSAATLTEGFNSNFRTSYDVTPTGNGSEDDVTIGSNSWRIYEAVAGNLANDRYNGTYSVRARNNSVIQMNFNKAGGAGIVSVYAAKYGTDANSTFRFEASTDGGATWTNTSSTFTVTTTTLTQFSWTANITGSVRIRIVKLSAGGDRTNFDDLSITDAASCTGPTTTGTTLTNSNATTTTIDLSFTGGNGTSRVVFLKSSAFTTATPAVNTTYSADASFASATSTAFDGGKTVYNNTVNTVSITDLAPNTVYNVKVFEYFGTAGSECYNTTALAGTFTSVSNAPTAANATSIGSTGFTANWNAPAGNGSASLTYTLDVSTDATFATGVTTQTGITATSYMVTGLNPNTSYYYRVSAVNAGGVSAFSNVTGPVMTTAAAPEIDLQAGASSVATGGNYTFSGNTVAGTSSSAVTFTIANNGNATLNLTGTPIIAISGTNVADFTITQSATTATVAASGTTTFTIAFNPSAPGTKNAVITIANDDADENPYTINLTGTGTSSATSNIIAGTGFTYAQNINYTLYQAATADNTNGIAAFGITVQDGGNTLTDADALPTQLASLTFSYTGTANTIRSAALYNGATFIANGSVSANGLSFTALSGVSAPDNGSVGLTLYITFNSTVTDNQQLQFTVSGATAGNAATSSQFAGATGAQSGITADNNRLIVTADRLVFGVQPVNTIINTAMTPAPTVRAVDANNNPDADFNSAVSITSTGTLTGTPVTINATAGVATFAALTHTATATGLTLSAQSTGLTGATSAMFDIIPAPTAPTGSYRTSGGGTWTGTSAGTSTWEQLQSNGNWTSVADPTFTAANVTSINIYILHTVTISGSATIANLVVQNGGTSIFSSSSTVTNSLLVQNGGTLQVNASLGVSSTKPFEVEDGGTVVANYAAFTGTAALFNGVENFHPASLFRISQFNGGGSALMTNITTVTYNNYTAGFGNLTFDFSADPGNNIDINPTAAFSNNIAHGNLRFAGNTGTQTVRIGTSGTTTSGIGGDFIVESTYGNGNINIKSSGTSLFTIGGDFILGGGSVKLYPGNSGTSVVNVNDVTVTGTGTLDFMGTSGAGASSTLNVSGNISVGSTATLQNSNAFAMSQLNLVGTTQSVSILKAGNYPNINVNINNNSTVTLLNDLTLSNVTLTSGIFNLGAFSLTIPVATTANSITNGTISGNTSSYIQGNLIRNTNLIADYEFPVGKTGYAPVIIRPSTTGTNSFMVNLNKGYHQTPNYTSVTAPLSAVNATEWYDITHPSGTATATITLPWGPLSNVTDYTKIVVAHYNSGTTAWESLGGTPAGSNNNGTVTIAGVSSFSPFAIGAINGAQPLPIKVSAFSLTKEASASRLNWTLATTDGNETVNLERSNDGKTFAAINTQTVEKAMVAKQSYTDVLPANGMNYYRLAITGSNGAVSYSKILTALFGKEVGNVRIYPNPAQQSLQVTWADAATSSTVEVRNSIDQLVWAATVTGTAHLEVPAASLSNGAYIITWKQGGTVKHQQIQVIH